MQENKAKKTILLVEDEAIIAMNEKIGLEECGYDVITVNTGKQAIEAFNKFPRIDLILMDINLGNEIDGTEAAEIILKNHDVPVVFLSNHLEPEVVEKTEKITSYGYIVKDSCITAIDASIKMAFKLFEANMLIRKNEIMQKTVMYNISDIISVFDTDGIVKFNIPNINLTKFSGWDSRELVGTSTFTRVHPEDAPRVRKAFETIIKEDKSSILMELRMQSRDGSYSPIEATLTNLVNDPVIGGVLVNCHDISERKKAEKALRESNLLLRQVVKYAPIATAVLDTGMCYIAASDRWLGDFKVNESDIIGKSHYDVFPGISRQWRDIYLKCLKGAIECSGNDSFERADGSMVHNRWEMRPWRFQDGTIGGVISYTEPLNKIDPVMSNGYVKSRDL
jgi:PAS domain S-box-containing protein